jgi:thioredoxin-like negative regulator of GroEL
MEPEEYGKWALASLDVDEIPELASSLKVIKVPSLFLINRGNAIH